MLDGRTTANDIAHGRDSGSLRAFFHQLHCGNPGLTDKEDDDIATARKLVADALALAFFTVLGAEKALAIHVAPQIAVVMGVITGVAGGMCRDVLMSEIPLVFRREIHLYATASAIGAGFFVTMRHWLPDRTVALVAGTLATLALRLAGIRWRLGLPEFDEPSRDDTPRP